MNIVDGRYYINTDTVSLDVSPFENIHFVYSFMKFWPKNIILYVLNHPASNPINECIEYVTVNSVDTIFL